MIRPRRLSRPTWLLVAAFALVAGLFATNRDMGGDPRSPRGDGKYRPVLARGDGHMLYLMARSTALDLDWRWDNDLGRFGDPWNQGRTATGRKGIPHPIGPALVWTPVIWVAQAGAWVGNLFGADIAMHGYTAWHQRIVFATSVLFAFGVALLIRAVSRRWIGGTWAPTYAAVAVLLGTSLTYYVTHMPSYGHAMDAFFSSAFLGAWALTIDRSDLRRYAILGALLGAAMLIRVQELGLGIVVAIEIGAQVIDAMRTPGDRARRAAALIGRGLLVLAVALLVFTPQLLAWQIVHGDWKGLPQGPRFTRWGSPMILETLFSARNGWLSWHPIAYAGVVGLAFVPRRARLIAIGFAAAIVVEVYLCSVVYDWWSGASFGQRRLCNVSLPVGVGLAALIAACGRAVAGRGPRALWHALVIVVLGWFLVWNIALVWQLRAGKAAGDGLRATCCRGVPMQAIAQPIYRWISNPWELPASAWFALRHGVGLSRWEATVGTYPLVPGLEPLRTDAWRKERATWDPSDPGRAAYLIAGWGPSQRGERRYRSTTSGRAEVMVPLLLPEPMRITVWIQPGGSRSVRLWWDGDVVADVPALRDGWQPVAFDVQGRAGMRVLAIESAPVGGTGVNVGAIELAFR